MLQTVKLELMNTSQIPEEAGHQVIPEAAVEAAAKEFAAIADPLGDWETPPDAYRAIYRGRARQILEAAAPHMLAIGGSCGDIDELARILLKDAYTLQSQPGMKDVCQHLTDAAIALDSLARG